MATALKVNGVYGMVVGLLLLFPSLAAAVFGYPVKDSAVTSGWGTTLIIVGLLSYVAAADAARYSGLARIFAGGLLLTAVDLLYYWLIGAYSARNVVVPVVINVVLAGWIWTSRGKGT